MRKANDKRQDNRGRPHVESKKKPYQVMLDPRYRKHAMAFSKREGIKIQDLFRLIFTAVIPDPFNAAPTVAFEQILALREKAIAFAAMKSPGRKRVS